MNISFGNYTLHTHTIGFDGRNTVAEMVERAQSLGLKTIGISNHFIVNPLIKKAKMYEYAVKGGYNNIYSESFDEAVEKFKPHYAEIESLREKYPDIKIMRGMEVDFFNNPKWCDGFVRSVEILKPDYIIGAAHFITYNGALLNSHDWKYADPETQDTLLTKYWENIGFAADSGLFNWMAHLDLPKKVRLGRGTKWIDVENSAIELISESGTAVEINNSGYKAPYYEPYPSLRILDMVQKHNVPVLISDDAHKVDDIGRNFAESEQLIKYFNLKRFENIK